MQPSKITIGTRGSQLALYQAYKVKDEIENHSPSTQVEVKIIKTKGDKILDVALSKIGDKGLFTKELEIALLNKEIDLAVHSLKDLPTELPSDFCIGAVLKRADFRDVLVSKNNIKLNQLTSQHKIATSSLRRIAGIKNINPEFTTIDIRGNVNTRLQKMEDGYCDAMIMAAAGLKRLELDHYITEILDPNEFIPAVAQGAIAIETLSDNTAVNEFLQNINHQPTLTEINAERSFMKTLMGGCQVPVGAFCSTQNNKITITGFVSSLDGKNYIKETMSGDMNNPEELGKKLAQALIARGANCILNEIRNQ
jgi:hydroxymethylbilane synthase